MELGTEKKEAAKPEEVQKIFRQRKKKIYTVIFPGFLITQSIYILYIIIGAEKSNGILL